MSLLRAHCDVGARSCLVGDHDVVKVSNLGKSIHFNDRAECKHIPETILLPIKWSAPEVGITTLALLLTYPDMHTHPSLI